MQRGRRSGGQRGLSRTPPEPGGTGTTPPARKRLHDMTPEEFIDWTTSRSAELADFSEYVQKWMQRRANQGKHNYHDEQYEAFQRQAADLIAALDELREAAEQAVVQQP